MSLSVPIVPSPTRSLIPSITCVCVSPPPPPVLLCSLSGTLTHSSPFSSSPMLRVSFGSLIFCHLIWCLISSGHSSPLLIVHHHPVPKLLCPSLSLSSICPLHPSTCLLIYINHIALVSSLVSAGPARHFTGGKLYFTHTIFPEVCKRVCVCLI